MECKQGMYNPSKLNSFVPNIASKIYYNVQTAMHFDGIAL